MALTKCDPFHDLGDLSSGFRAFPGHRQPAAQRAPLRAPLGPRLWTFSKPTTNSRSRPTFHGWT
jgi:hypothetical protein